MDFRLTEEQREFESLARRVAGALAERDSGAAGEVDWELLVNTGLMGLLIDADAGGSGATLVESPRLPSNSSIRPPSATTFARRSRPDNP
jgi:alkylation response protein AidB-like acyl-CoA dehydrogenase